MKRMFNNYPLLNTLIAVLTGCNIEVSFWFDFQIVETAFGTIKSFNGRLWDKGFDLSADVCLRYFCSENEIREIHW